MSNHDHFLICATREELSRFMNRVNHRYSLYHNDLHGLEGHAFCGPYEAKELPGEFLLPTIAAYIFLNPVRAGIVKSVDQYPWSGYAGFLSPGASVVPLDPAPVLRVLSPDPKAAQVAFQEVLREMASKPKRRQEGVPTAFEVARHQFDALLQRAHRMNGALSPLDPTDVAIYWGRECGIPPRVMSSVLEDRSARWISTRLLQMKQRIAHQPGLAAGLKLP